MSLDVSERTHEAGSVTRVVFDDFAREFSAAVAKELHDQREERQVPWKTLMEETGLSRSHLNKLLTGKASIELEELVLICASLGVDPFVLMRNARTRLKSPDR